MTNRYIKYCEKLEFQPEGCISKFFSKILPKPKPDFDDLYESVHTWYLEIEPQYGLANREVGFNHEGHPIVFGPFGTNRGLWIDSPVKFNADDFDNISQEEFEQYWKELEKKFK